MSMPYSRVHIHGVKKFFVQHNHNGSVIPMIGYQMMNYVYDANKLSNVVPLVGFLLTFIKL